MQTISIKLPDELLGQSTRLAQRLAMTRSDLIRLALEHEVRRQEKRLRREQLREAAKVLASSSVAEPEAAYWVELDTDLGIGEEAPWWKNQ
jgi:metal-responsive CopG/Arc/MetJ family transcriptional regulator